MESLSSGPMPTRTWNRRWARHLSHFGGEAGYYGDQWGDPSLGRLALLWRRLRRGERPPGDLAKVVKRYLCPYVTAEARVLEIGPGGGRWTQFLLPASEIVLVDLNGEFFPYLEDRFREHAAKLRFYETSGYELAGVETESVDFVFSFGTFVHIRPGGIDEYLGEIGRVLRPRGVASIQYADRTKPYFRDAEREGYHGFSDMNGKKMQRLLRKHRFQVVEHDRAVMKHSNMVVFRKPDDP